MEKKKKGVKRRGVKEDGVALQKKKQGERKPVSLCRLFIDEGNWVAF